MRCTRSREVRAFWNGESLVAARRSLTLSRHVVALWKWAKVQFRPQLSIGTMLIATLVSAILLAVACNWSSILGRTKYGTPVPLGKISIIGFTNRHFILEIQGKRYTTANCSALSQYAALLATGQTEGLPDLTIMHAWKSGTQNPVFTLQVQDEHLRTLAK